MDSDYDKGCLAGPQGSVLDISVKEDNPNYDAPVVSDNDADASSAGSETESEDSKVYIMPYVSVSACAPSLCFQSQAFLQFVTLFFLSLSTSSLNDAHPLAVKLNKLIEDGKIPESCIYYKFLNDTMSFALTDPKTASCFKWDDEVCEFFSTIKYLGGERTRKFVRGPGFFGTGRGG